ncbi:MAG: endolytic transglycosylase MltG [Eubacteriales bacterium]|nr:endolytic transglycosylase MltG [Eubacteriales bacterium]
MQAKKILTRLLLMLLKVLLAVIIVTGIYHFGEYAYHFGHSLYDNRAVSDPPGRDVAVVIPEGCTVSQIAKLLEAKGLIEDEKVFRVQERTSQYHGQLKAGNYVLNTSQSAEEMLAILSGHGEDVADGDGGT